MSKQAATGARPRTGSVTRGQGKASSSSAAPPPQSRLSTSKSPIVSDSVWICKYCKNSFTKETDTLLQCDRCDLPVCTDCAKMDAVEYSLMSRQDVQWFCSKECREKALLSIKTDFEIEEKCAKYCQSITARLENVEMSLSLKADKASHDNLTTVVSTTNQHMIGISKDISALNHKLDLVRKEPQEIERRKKNIVLRGIPEDSDEKQAVDHVFDAIGFADEPTLVTRLGKKMEGKGRPIKIILSSEAKKWEILKKAPTIRNSINLVFDKRKIFIVPDLTVLQREDDIKLRNELKLKRELNPNWKIKKGRLYLAEEVVTPHILDVSSLPQRGDPSPAGE